LSNVLLLSNAPEPPAEILPSLSLLPHTVRLAPAVAGSAVGTPPADLVLVDARRDLVQVRQLLRQLRATGLDVPILIIVAEGGWAAVSADWGADDVILHTAGPGEVDARLRIAVGRAVPAESGEIRSGDLAIDEPTYSARLRGRALDLTFKEFELLKFLAQSPGRVFSRSQLLQEVWGYDYFGGTRTVDVHVRRLRAKLGAEHEALIGTVRNVGYRFVPVKGESERPATDADPADGSEPSGDPADGSEPSGDPGQDNSHSQSHGHSQGHGHGEPERGGRPAPDRVPGADAAQRREARSAHAER
jgi:DNA-binding response OmpR family regulator